MPSSAIDAASLISAAFQLEKHVTWIDFPAGADTVAGERSKFKFTVERDGVAAEELRGLRDTQGCSSLGKQEPNIHNNLQGSGNEPKSKNG
jgi:hypothetical protein